MCIAQPIGKWFPEVVEFLWNQLLKPESNTCHTQRKMCIPWLVSWSCKHFSKVTYLLKVVGFNDKAKLLLWRCTFRVSDSYLVAECFKTIWCLPNKLQVTASDQGNNWSSTLLATDYTLRQPATSRNHLTTTWGIVFPCDQKLPRGCQLVSGPLQLCKHLKNAIKSDYPV